MNDEDTLCLFPLPTKPSGSRPCLRPRREHFCPEHRYSFKKIEGCERQHHPFQRESAFDLLPYDIGVLRRSEYG